MKRPRVAFTRVGRKPLMVPDMTLKWESGGIMCPAVIQEGGIYHMLYRAYGADNISRMGYATSSDGVEWTRRPEPVAVPRRGDEQESRGIEDPRIVKLDNHFYITYTAVTGSYRGSSSWDWIWQPDIRILKTVDFERFERILPVLPDMRNNKDGVLFSEKVHGKYFLLHRMEPDIWLCYSDDLINWTDHHRVLSPQPRSWQSWKLGAGTPPIRTELGWLLFYHGVSQDKTYSMGAAILDEHDPYIVRYRLPYALIKPAVYYEKKGGVNDVVFGTSVVERDGEYWLYYGAADFVIAAARLGRESLLGALERHPVRSAVSKYHVNH